MLRQYVTVVTIVLRAFNKNDYLNHHRPVRPQFLVCWLPGHELRIIAKNIMR